MMCQSSCACWTPEHAQDPHCIAVRSVVDCTKDTALAAVTGMFSDLLASQGNWDAIKGQVNSRLINLGFKDGGCALASIEAEFLGKPRASPEMAHKTEGIHGLMVAWKKEHHAEDIRFKVRTSDGREVLR